MLFHLRYTATFLVASWYCSPIGPPPQPEGRVHSDITCTRLPKTGAYPERDQGAQGSEGVRGSLEINREAPASGRGERSAGHAQSSLGRRPMLSLKTSTRRWCLWVFASIRLFAVDDFGYNVNSNDSVLERTTSLRGGGGGGEASNRLVFPGDWKTLALLKRERGGGEEVRRRLEEEIQTGGQDSPVKRGGESV